MMDSLMEELAESECRALLKTHHLPSNWCGLASGALEEV